VIGDALGMFLNRGGTRVCGGGLVRGGFIGGGLRCVTLGLKTGFEVIDVGFQIILFDALGQQVFFCANFPCVVGDTLGIFSNRGGAYGICQAAVAAVVAVVIGIGKYDNKNNRYNQPKQYAAANRSVSTFKEFAAS
jgi:hypothetical protein